MANAKKTLKWTHNILNGKFVYRQELILNLATEGFAKSTLVLERINNELLEFEHILQGNQKGFIFCLAAITYFANGKYKEALKWTHNILNGKLSDFRNDIINCAKIIGNFNFS